MNCNYLRALKLPHWVVGWMVGRKCSAIPGVMGASLRVPGNRRHLKESPATYAEIPAWEAKAEHLPDGLGPCLRSFSNSYLCLSGAKQQPDHWRQTGEAATLWLSPPGKGYKGRSGSGKCSERREEFGKADAGGTGLLWMPTGYPRRPQRGELLSLGGRQKDGV